MDIVTRFKAYREINKEIDFQIDRLERMEDRTSSPASASLTGMPKNPSPQQDRLALDVAKIVDLKADIKMLSEKRDDERKILDDLINHLKNPEKKFVLRLRYIDLEEWEDVQFVMYGGKEDYNEKYDTYKTRMFREHRAALTELENISC